MLSHRRVQIGDSGGNVAEVTPYGEMHTVQPVRLVGGVFNDSTANPNLFTVTNTNGGTTTVSDTVAILATNTTANGATQIYTAQVARFVGGTSNRFYGRVSLGDTGTANNTRRWGMMAPGGADGILFQLSGTTLSVVTRKGGTNTATIITSSVTLTNLNLYEIDYNSGVVYFTINGAVVKTFSSSAPYLQNIQLAAFIDNTNSGGSTTNVTISSVDLTAYRLGSLSTQPLAGRITTAGTATFKNGPGLLHRLTLNNPGGNLITIYDNTAGSGTTLAVINTPAQANPVTLEYGIQFSTGLTVVSTGTWDATIVFE